MVLWSGILPWDPIKARAPGVGGPVHLPPGVTSPHLECKNAPATSATEDCLPDLSNGQNKHALRRRELYYLSSSGSPLTAVGLLPPKVTR